MKADQVLQDIRALEGDELSNRLKQARRDLYELRFKLAVGQLEDSSQIHKIRKDIARILTVIRQRELGEPVIEAPEPVEAAAAEEPETAEETQAAENEEDEETDE